MSYLHSKIGHSDRIFRCLMKNVNHKGIVKCLKIYENKT